METTLRGLGWVVSLTWALVFFGGMGYLVPAGLHLYLGLAVLMGALLLHVLPYFAIIGGVARLRQEAGFEREKRLEMAVQLKARHFWPTFFVVLVLLAGPVLSFLQLGDRVPAWTHGSVMALGFALHLWAWAKGLFAMRILAGLSRLESE